MDQNFLDQVVRLLSVRRNAAVVLLVHEGAGLEVLSNTEDMVHKRGMLEMGVDMLREARWMNEEAQRQAQSKAEATVALLNKPEGKAN